MKVGFLFVLAALALLSGTHGLRCQDEVAKIVRKNFEEVDSNKDNLITFNEQAAIALHFDINDDFVITEKEFRTEVSEHFQECEVLTPELMRGMDANNNKILTVMEMMVAVWRIDVNGDGSATPEEYTKVWTELLTALFKGREKDLKNCTW